MCLDARQVTWSVGQDGRPRWCGARQRTELRCDNAPRRRAFPRRSLTPTAAALLPSLFSRSLSLQGPRAIYTVRLTTGDERGAGLSDPQARVVVLLVDEVRRDGESSDLPSRRALARSRRVF